MKAAVVILGCLLVLALTNSIESKVIKSRATHRREPRGTDDRQSIDEIVNSFVRLVARDVDEVAKGFDLGKALAFAKKGMDIAQSLKDRDLTAALKAGKELFADFVAPAKK